MDFTSLFTVSIDYFEQVNVSYDQPLPCKYFHFNAFQYSEVATRSVQF